MAQKSGLLILLTAALGFQGALAEEASVNSAPTPEPLPAASSKPSPKPAPTMTPAPTAIPTVAPSPTHQPANQAPVAQAPARPVPPPENQMLENLPPEQRKRFQANLEKWMKLPKVQQDELRREAKFHSERIRQEINEAIEKTGLKLDQQQRQVFIFRYAQERRTLEEKLRVDMEEKRREAILELIWQLSAEFQPLPPDPGASPQP